MTKFLTLLLLFFVFLSCQTPSQYEKVKSFLNVINQDIDLNDYKGLIVINERGSCINCNFAFSQAISKHIGNENVLFIVSTAGNNIDISPYLESEKSNIIFDYNNNFFKLKMVDRCAIFTLSNQSIDTIIEINLDNIQMSYDFFKKNLEN
jgi:hypothetical protein